MYSKDCYKPFIRLHYKCGHKYADQLILDIKGCVCGISSCTLTVVSQDSVSSWDIKVKQCTKVAWFVLAACTPSISVPLSRWPWRAMFCRPHKTIISVIEQSISFCCSGWFLLLLLCWINTLSRLPLTLSTEASQTAMASMWYSQAAWRSHTSYIFLKIVNAVSTSNPLPFHTSMLLAKSTQGRQYPPFSCQL